MEWLIECRIIPRGNTLAKAIFLFKDVEIGAIDVNRQAQSSPGAAFAELIRYPHRWNILPPELHEAFAVFRKETLANIDDQSKTYRFIDVDAARGLWKLTTDKSDIRIE